MKIAVATVLLAVCYQALASDCQAKRQRALGHVHGGMMGGFVPRCNSDGRYYHTQCHGSMCFCVDRETGQQVPESGGHIARKGDVEERCSQFSKRGMESTCTEQRRKAESSGLLGRFTPMCEADGSFKRFQCHERYCFCVDPASGEKMQGSAMSMEDFSSFDEAEQSCSLGSFDEQTLAQVTECEAKRTAALNSGLIGAFVPRCEDDGSYHHIQCHGSMCFCAHPETGESRGDGGSISDLEEVERKCQTYTKRGVTSKCQEQREKILSSGLIGAHAPLCEEDGSYSRMQCREAMCYCADPESGEAIEGSTGHVSEYSEMQTYCNSLGTFHNFDAEYVPKKDCKNKRIAYRWNKCPKECKYHQGYGEALVVCCCD